MLTGSAGASCSLADGANENTNTTNAALRYWDAPSWAFTAKVKVSALDGSRLTIRVAHQNTADSSARMVLTFASVGGTVSVQNPGAGQDDQPFTWQANTWYSIKWAVIWGDQQRLRVWVAAQSEPTTWTASTTAGLPEALPFHSPFMTEWHSTVGATSVFQDDYAFGPAPILPKFPPPPDTDHNAPDPNSANGGDPVNTFTGSFGYHHTDVAIPGRGPALTFSRSYNSNDTRTTSLGPGWTHSYNIRLNDPNDGTSDVILVGPQGRSDRYVWTGNAYTAPVGVHRTLVKNSDGSYTATDKDLTVWQFDGSGLLTQIADRYGNASNLSYDVNNRLTSISDPAGRGSLTLAYTNGLLTGVTDWASPARTVGYQYDASNRLWKVTDREGKVTTFGYDGTSSRLATITDARTNTALTLAYDASGRVQSQKDARGVATGDATTFSYVVNGDGTRVTTVTSPTTSFEPAFHPTVVDSYSANGWLGSRVASPSSSETLTESYTYDTAGNRTSVTDPRGNRTDFCFDVDYAGAGIAGAAANLTRRIDPPPTAGANRPVTLTKYDANNNVIQRVTPKGVPSGATVTCSTNLSAINTSYATDYAYDASAIKLLSTTTRFTDPDMGGKTATTKYEYGDAANPGLVTRTIPPRGNTTGTPDYTYATTFTYFGSGANAGMLASVSDPLGDLTTLNYDSVGRLTSRVDPVGNPSIGGVATYHTTSFTYDKEDRLRTQTAPGPIAGNPGLVTETRYDEVGNPIVRIDAGGQVTTFTYDERDSLSQVKEATAAWTDPANPPAGAITTEYTYDAAGNRVRVTRAKGDAANERVVDYTFDGRGLERSETQYPSWPTTSPTLVTARSYDPDGNVATLVDPLGRTTTDGYDTLNRLTSMTYSDGVTPNASFGYDANGNRSSMTDGTGSSSYVYDESNRLTSATTPGPKTVGYRYDLDGNRTKVIYPDLTAVTYTFNKGGQLGSLQDWAGRSVAYTYWPDGLVKTATNPDATVASYAYDNARRLIDIAHTNSGGQYLDRSYYTLNRAGNVTGVNHGLLPAQVARPDGLVGSNGTWTGTFASINEVTPNDTTILASPAGPTSANYYEVSLSDVLPPMDITSLKIRMHISKSGNDSGQSISLGVELRQGTTVINSVTYQNLPGSSGTGWQNNTLDFFAADPIPTVSNYNDLRIRFTPTASGGGQARKAQISWLELDVPSGADSTAATTYTYDGLSRLTGSTGQNGTFAYGYDPVGNRTSVTAGTTTTSTYDRADRITAAGALSISVDAAGNTTARGPDSFAFDQANRLKAATVSGTSEAYQYDADGLRFSRQIGAGSPIRFVSDVNSAVPVTIDDGTRKYVYGLGLAYAVLGSTVEVYHADRGGTIRALTTGGSVVATNRLDDWGNVIAQTGASTQPYRFAGEAADATGLTYLRSRYYDPSLGRLASRDALAGDIRQSATLNRFGYAIDNPIRFTDPTGRKAQGLSPLADFANIHTAGACLTSTVNLFLWYWSSSVCRVIDETGQQAVLIINGNGFGPGLGFSDTPGAFVSNGRSVTDQAGAFSDFNASVGYPTWGGTYTKSTGTNAAGQQITSHIVSIGPGYGTPSITFGNSNTTVVTDPQLVQLYQSSLGNNLPAAP